MSQESTEKIIDYLARVSKEPITVDGVTYHIPPPDCVTLDATFFIKDDCIMCGKCCPNETTVWTKSGMCKILDVSPREYLSKCLDPATNDTLVTRIQTITHSINGNLVDFFVSAADEEKEATKLSWEDRAEVSRCHWLIERDGNHVCAIHPVRSVTCGLPHIRFVNRNLHTVIRTGQFGRNWRLKCPIEFSVVHDGPSLLTKIHWLQELLKVAEDLRVDTYLPEMVQYLVSGNTKPKNFFKEIRPKLFRGVDYGTSKEETVCRTANPDGGREYWVSTLFRGQSEQGGGEIPSGEGSQSAGEPTD